MDRQSSIVHAMRPNRVETYADACRVEADFADDAGFGYHFLRGFGFVEGVDFQDDEVLLLGG
jgi:hypothetical protein